MSDAAWRFRPSPIDGGRTGGDQAAMNFEHDLETFVREVLQNSLDARKTGTSIVTVEFSVERLTGDAKRSFLEAMGWAQLRPHIEASRRLAPAFTAALPRLDDPKQPLLILVIHDAGALGLSGPERGEGRFASFVRNKLFSDKESGSAGGSYGLGKSVLWAFSGVSTILVHSCPVATKPADPKERCIGVTQLPWHECADEECDGPGWFGIAGRDQRGVFSASFAAPKELLSALRLTRPPGADTGTSIVVPDFQSESEPSALADELSRAAAKWFWPALVGPDRSLQVRIRVGAEQRVVNPADHRELRPFLHLAGLAVHPVWTPRTVSGTEPLKLPAVRDTMLDQERFLVHDAHQVPDAFRLEAITLEDAHGDLDKHMAMIRGARMVVRYHKLTSDRPVWAIARAGTACATSAADQRVEQFLRHAEPPSHNDWDPHAPKLHDRYKPGFVGELKGVKKRLADRVMVMLRKQEGAQAKQEIPPMLRKVLAASLGSSPGDIEREGRFDYGVDTCQLLSTAQGLVWQFSGWVQNTREGPWELQAEAWLDTDGVKTPVGVEGLHVDGLFTQRTERGLRIEGSGHLPFRGTCPLAGLGAQAGRAVFALQLKQHAPRNDDKKPEARS